MTTEERFEMLEKELAAAKRLTNRLMSGACVVLAMIVLCVAARSMNGVAQSQTGDSNKIITAKAFMVVDDQGKIRAGLVVTKDGSGLSLCDKNGKPRVGLGVIEDVPGLVLYDVTGKSLVRLAVTEDVPGLSLHDENGVIRAMLGVTKMGPGLILHGENGNVIWQAP